MDKRVIKKEKRKRVRWGDKKGNQRKRDILRYNQKERERDLEAKNEREVNSQIERSIAREIDS